MARFAGNIGFSKLVETSPGIWEDDVVVSKKYYGDILKNNIKNQQSGNVNDNIIVSNRISIVSDPFANENFQSIVYVEYMGVKWKVTDISIERPRLILSIGGVYNGR